MAFKWMADGDSVTIGYGLATGDKTYLQWAVADALMLLTATIPAPTNVAVPGYTLNQMLNGGPNWTGTLRGATTTITAPGSLAAKLAGQNYDMVSLMTGINDAGFLQSGTLTIAGFKSDLRTYINTVLAQPGQQGRQCFMVLLGPSPVILPNTLSATNQDAIARAVREVASEYANNPYFLYLDVTGLFRPVGLGSSLLPTFIQADGIHINNLGHHIAGLLLTGPLYWRNALPGFGSSADLVNRSPLTLSPVTLKTSTLQAALGEYDGPDLTTSNILIQAVGG